MLIYGGIARPIRRIWYHRHWYSVASVGEHFRHHRIGTTLAADIHRGSISVRSDRWQPILRLPLRIRLSSWFRSRSKIIRGLHRTDRRRHLVVWRPSRPICRWHAALHRASWRQHTVHSEQLLPGGTWMVLWERPSTQPGQIRSDRHRHGRQKSTRGRVWDDESRWHSDHCFQTVKSLGITLDDTLSFNSHVDNVCKAAHFHIRALRHIRGCIDEETAGMVASSMVGSRLDYFNSVLYGTSAGNIGKFQRVLHTLARVVSGTRKSDHITPVLARLHWLPVAARATFKIALLTYKAITTKKPDYLAEMPRFLGHIKDTSIVLKKASACERC